MQDNFLFIYYKDGAIKALGIEDAKEQHFHLISEGYTQTATIDSISWIESLFNNKTNDEQIQFINSLSKS